MRRKSEASSDDLRLDYAFDYSKAVRGKYSRRLRKDNTNVELFAAITELCPTVLQANEHHGVCRMLTSTYTCAKITANFL